MIVKFRVTRSEQSQKNYHLTLEVVGNPDEAFVGGSVQLEVRKTHFRRKPELNEELDVDFGGGLAAPSVEGQ